MQGRQTRGRGWGSQPPLNFGRGVEYLSTPPDIERFKKKIAHILCYYVQVITIRGGGGGWLPLN